MRREDCIVDCVGPDCEGCRNYKTRQMKDEIKDKIIEKQDEYIFHLFKRLNDINTPLYVHGFHSALADEAERLKSELSSLKSQLAKAGEEKPIIKKCRQCRFFDLDEHCEPCESCYPIAYSNWQPR